MFKAICFAALLALSFPVDAKDFGTYVIHKEDILEVYDGDTIYITNKNCPPVFCEKIGVRLNGIDTPEKRTRCLHEKLLAEQARKELQNAIRHGKVIELRHTTKEKFGRLLGDLYIDDEDFAEKLVANGLAVRYHGERKTKDWCE